MPTGTNSETDFHGEYLDMDLVNEDDDSYAKVTVNKFSRIEDWRLTHQD